MRVHTFGQLMSVLCLSAGLANAQPTMPNEFETPTSALVPMFSFFGGVNGFGSDVDLGVNIFTGAALRVFANFQHDSFFSVAGFGIGANNISAANLGIDPVADTFSVTIESPGAGTLSFFVTIFEDDDSDGIASDLSNDDEWESPVLLLNPGVNVYNIPSIDMALVNAGIGNDIQNFTTAPTITLVFTFESKATYPGGIIEVPISFHLDHAGFYVGDQIAPDAGNPADLTGDGVVNSADLASLLAQWGAVGPADLNSDGVVNGVDLAQLLANWS